MSTPRIEEEKSRVLPYRLRWTRAHNAIYWTDEKLARDDALTFWQTLSTIIILNEYMLTEFLVKVTTRNQNKMEEEILEQESCVGITMSSSNRAHARFLSMRTSRKLIRLISRSDQRVHDVSPSEVPDVQVRKQLNDKLTRFVSNHQDKKKLVDELCIDSDDAYESMGVSTKETIWKRGHIEALELCELWQRVQYEYCRKYKNPQDVFSVTTENQYHRRTKIRISKTNCCNSRNFGTKRLRVPSSWSIRKG